MTPHKMIHYFSAIIFFVLGIAFMIVALVIVGVSAWKLFVTPCNQCDLLQELLDFVVYLIMAVAIFDVGFYLLEEQSFRARKLSSLGEARQSLTKFMVIIVIAVSLDSLLTVLKASSTDIRLLIYPATLFLVAVFLLIGLGLYQRFSVLAEKDIQKNEPRR